MILLSDYSGNWDLYLEAVYKHFCDDFLSTPKLEFQGLPVNLKRYPVERDKEATFWHFISEGKTEEDREINFRRCERIRWPRAMMENVSDPDLMVWEQHVRSELRTHIWCEEHGYLVVVAKRTGFVLPWTAYCVTQQHEQRKLRNRWLQHQ